MRGRRRSGIALIVVLAALVVVTAAATATTAATLRSVEGARLARLRSAARLAAEGGVEAARAALARDPEWSGGDVGVGETTVAVEVRKGAAADERLVVSFARFAPDGDARPAANATIEATLRVGAGLPRCLAWRER